MNPKLPLSLVFLTLAAPAFISPALAQTPPSPLPIKQVTVFTSGVSYIERDGTVTGDAVVPLTFRTAQINDLLKSMTLIDSQDQVQLDDVVGIRLLDPRLDQEFRSPLTTLASGFAVSVPAGKTATLDVVTEKPDSSTVAQDIPTATRAALASIAKQRRHLQNLTEIAASDESQVTQISAQQDRIRRNMAALDRTSPLYKRYVGEMEAQETQIASLRADAQRQRSAAAATKTLRDTLDI